MTKRLKQWQFLAAILLLALTSCKTPPSKITAVRPYNPRLSSFKFPYQGISKESTGYILYDLSENRVVDENQRTTPFLPGSVSKIITTSIALRLLGADYRFKTVLTTDGSVAKKTLKGNLFLTGFGDPFLTLSDLMAMVQNLKNQGINKVSGHFYFDENLFPSRPRIDMQRDQISAFNPGVSALSSEFNRVYLKWRPIPSRPHEVEAFAIPSLSLFRIGLSEQSEPDTDVLKNDITAEDWLISPSADRNGRQNIPVRQPAFFTSLLFTYLARLEGIEIPDPSPTPSKSMPKKIKILVSHSSMTLLELCERTLENSNNLMAELIFNATAGALRKKSNVAEPSVVITEWLKRKLPRANWNGFQLANGSGLGSGTQTSPEQMLEILKLAEGLSLQGRRFTSLLPISGWKGTLSGRMNEPDLALRVWAKTGTLSFSTGLAGGLYSQSGKTYLFVIFIADRLGRKQIEQYDSVVPKTLNDKAKSWTSKGQALQDALLARWIQTF